MDKTVSLEGALRLDHLGVIRASGSDAAKFLHGQLSNDVATLDPSKARLAGFCSAKGRLQASFVYWRVPGGDVLLACSAGLLPAVLKRLSMFVLRLQCELSDASDRLALYGLAGAAAQERVSGLAPWGKRDDAQGGTVIRLPDAAGVPRGLLAVPADRAGAAPAAGGLDAGAWRWLEVQSGVPWIEAATAEQFVPQMVNFELVGGVDFQKGCYPGQEVVARSQYRGTLKRRMALFDVQAQAAPGQEVFHSADPGQPAGMVVNAAPNPRAAGSSALVEVKLAALGSGSLHLGSADGARLERRPLPYPVPVEEAQGA